MVNSGSSANLLALASLNLKKGDEVITPTLTFSTTVAPIYQQGLTPHFIDVERNSFVANLEQIKKAIELMYDVAVIDVNTMNYAGKSKSRYTKAGMINGKTASYKKAIVTLKDGDSIDFFSNI